MDYGFEVGVFGEVGSEGDGFSWAEKGVEFLDGVFEVGCFAGDEDYFFAAGVEEGGCGVEAYASGSFGVLDISILSRGG